jgi:DNA invertase Pin-like site-specific DNA recombinase
VLSVFKQIKGTVDEMEREVEAQRQHAGAVRARRRGGADDPQRRSKSALRERPGNNSGSGDSPSRRRARSSDPPPAKEKAREKGWTFKSSPPVKKVCNCPAVRPLTFEPLWVSL